jgi:hypothetical protein
LIKKGGDGLMNGKQFVVATLFAICLLTLIFIPLTSQSAGTYDPWLDYNGDGKVDANDLHLIAQTYGASGDPTRNVNVTNWPVQSELFPQDLILRAAYYYLSQNLSRRDLFDKTTAPPSEAFSNDSVTLMLDRTGEEIYNQTFTYQKIPTSPYLILGKPTVNLAFNITNSPSASLVIYFQVYIGPVDAKEIMTPLYLGNYTCEYNGAATDLQFNTYLISESPFSTVINANERLGVLIMFGGYTLSGTTALTLKILLGTNTDNFVVDVPIVSNTTFTP